MLTDIGCTPLSSVGHRSQAPPEVRHVSGQHIKEFRDFLSRFPEEFVGTCRLKLNHTIFQIIYHKQLIYNCN